MVKVKLEFPDLAWRERQIRHALEVRIDALPEEFQDQWHLPVHEFASRWIAQNSFTEKATLWQWGNMSANIIPRADFGWSEFIIQFGLPRSFMQGLERHLVATFRGCVRLSEMMPALRDDGWSPFCHIEQGRVWEQEDVYVWIPATATR